LEEVFFLALFLLKRFIGCVIIKPIIRYILITPAKSSERWMMIGQTMPAAKPKYFN